MQLEVFFSFLFSKAASILFVFRWEISITWLWDLCNAGSSWRIVYVTTAPKVWSQFWRSKKSRHVKSPVIKSSLLNHPYKKNRAEYCAGCILKQSCIIVRCADWFRCTDPQADIVFAHYERDEKAFRAISRSARTKEINLKTPLLNNIRNKCCNNYSSSYCCDGNLFWSLIHQGEERWVVQFDTIILSYIKDSRVYCHMHNNYI